MSENETPPPPTRKPEGASFDPTVGRVSGKKLVLSVLGFVGLVLIVHRLVLMFYVK